MEKTVWNVGDACFIVEMKTDPRFVQMRVLPATVVQVFDEKQTLARALAYTKDIYGPQIAEGEPFSTEQDARLYLAEYAERMRKAAFEAKLHGERPRWQLPANAPKQGDIVYAIDPDEKLILRVQIAVTRIECGRMEVAYDTGDPEASYILLKEWWATKVAAEEYVAEKYLGTQFIFEDCVGTAAAA